MSQVVYNFFSFAVGKAVKARPLECATAIHADKSKREKEDNDHGL